MSVRTLTAQDLLDLEHKAAANPRRRANLNLHGDDSALLHRFVISMCDDSYVRPHRHREPHKLEMATMLAGAMDWIFFDEQGRVTQRVRVDAQGPVRAVEVPPGVFHGVVPVTPSGAFLEVKQGPYVAASDKEFAPWAPAEGSPGSPACLDWLRRAQAGERYA